MTRGFADRADAGGRLADVIEGLKSEGPPVVLALPRGGVPVAREVALRLGAPLDILVVRKIGVPGHRELAMGAVASGGLIVRNDDVVTGLRIDDETFERGVAKAMAELREREALLRGPQRAVDVTSRTVFVVDDGMATGSTMRAAVEALRARDPAEIIVAVPVAAPDVVRAIEQTADRVVCLLTPRSLGAVGLWYRKFGQTSDDEVRRLLSG